jgi:hypothetical protein
MEFARTLRELFTHRLLLGVGVAVAIAAAAIGASSGSLTHSGASTQVLVDARASVLGSVTQPFEPLASRAQVYANFMASPAFLEEVGKRVGIKGSQIYAAGPVNANEPRVEQEPTALKRNVQITGETKPYRLNYESQANLPTIGIYAQAPTTSMAVGLANGAAASLASYVARVEAAAGIPVRSQIVIRQLGPAAGSVSDGGIGKSIAFLIFIVVLAFWCVLVLVGTRFRETWSASALPPAPVDAGHEPLEVRREPLEVRPEPEPARGTREAVQAGREPVQQARREPAQSRREPVQSRHEPLEAMHEPLEIVQEPVDIRPEAVQGRREPVRSEARAAQAPGDEARERRKQRSGSAKRGRGLSSEAVAAKAAAAEQAWRGREENGAVAPNGENGRKGSKQGESSHAGGHESPTPVPIPVPARSRRV